MQAIQDKSIRAEQSWPVDITPMLTHLLALGLKDALSIPGLTIKLCRLLGVCGNLRPSSIERIDLAQSDWTTFHDRILLQAVVPKTCTFPLIRLEKMAAQSLDPPSRIMRTDVRSYNLSQKNQYSCNAKHTAYRLTPKWKVAVSIRFVDPPFNNL
jgi:hypothetical protein